MKNLTAVFGPIMLDVEHIGSLRPKSVNDINRLVIEETRHSLGGAGNLISNLTAQGTDVLPVCWHGDDEAGLRIRRMLSEQGIASESCLPLNGAQTTVINYYFDHTQGQVFGAELPRIVDLPASAQDAAQDRLQAARRKAQDLVITDYDKDGKLPNQVFATITQKWSAGGGRVFVDTKMREGRVYDGAFLIKPNFFEACRMCGKDGSVEKKDPSTVRSLMEAIHQHHNVQHVLLTLAGQGFVLGSKTSAGIDYFEQPALATKVASEVGAGDTMMAALVARFQQSGDIRAATVWANHAAALAVMQPGTTIISAQATQAALENPGQAGLKSAAA